MFFGRYVRIRVFLRTLNFKISVVCLSHSERVSVLDPAKTTVLSPYLTTTYNLQKYLYNFIFYKIFPKVYAKRSNEKNLYLTWNLFWHRKIPCSG